uniref:Glucuronosyltransferase n=1 Tax=Haemonchus placei TaxID=6290 RepID=A0A0N4WNJ7_HAEPC
LHLCDSYKILVVVPKLAYSHMNFMGQIADTLADAGNDVVIFGNNFFIFLIPNKYNQISIGLPYVPSLPYVVVRHDMTNTKKMFDPTFYDLNAMQ